MIFGGFSKEKVSWKCSGVKRLNIAIIYDISEQEKNTRLFNAKFRARGERDLSSKTLKFDIVTYNREPYTNHVSQSMVFGDINHARLVLETSI